MNSSYCRISKIPPCVKKNSECSHTQSTFCFLWVCTNPWPGMSLSNISNTLDAQCDGVRAIYLKKVTSKIIVICCGPCNSSKWEAEFWGWLEVWRPALLCFTVNLVSPLSLLTVWLGVGERVIWAVGYIHQLKLQLASSSGICWWV